MALHIKKSHFYIILGISVVFLVGIVLFILKDSLLPAKKISSANMAPSPKVEEKAPEIKFASYDDPLGFSVSYPEKYQLNKHPEDKTNYSNLELTGGSTENFHITISDTLSTDLNQVIKNDKELKTGSVLDTEISKVPFKKILLTGANKTVLVGIWDGMLFKIEVSPADVKEYSQIVEKIIESFKIPETANYTDGSAPAFTDNSDTSGSSETSDDSSIEEIE